MTNDQPLNQRTKLSAVLALLLLVPVPSIGVYIAVASEHTHGLAFGWAIYGLSKAWILALPALWHVFVDKNRLSLSPARHGGFYTGIVIGLFMMAAIIVTYHFAIGLVDVEHMRQANASNGLSTPARFFMLVIPLTLVNSLLEEYVWRWFVFRKCEILVGGIPGAILSGLFFSGHHIVALHAQTNWTITAMAVTGVFIAGTLWSWCYWRFRSIWPGYVSHIIADAGVYIVGYWVLFGSSA